MNETRHSTTRVIVTALFSIALISACKTAGGTVPRSQAEGAEQSAAQPLVHITIKAPTASPLPPTATPLPLAAIVNGSPITIEQFHAELAHYLDDVDPNSAQAAEVQKTTLNTLIENALILQEATRRGITMSEQQIDEEINIARARAGGDDAYVTWLAASKLTQEEARERVRIALMTSALRDKVVVNIPREADHVRAFHILAATEIEAQQILEKLNAGAVFGPLATRYSIDEGTRADEGDLGWFPRGADAVLWPEVEEAAFNLAPGDTSGIIASPAGFHIVRVVAREMQPLNEVNYSALQQHALEGWIAGLLKSAKVERYL